MVDQVKGVVQAAPMSEAELTLKQMAVAHYANTDHDCLAGRLIQGQVDHSIKIGTRCYSTPEEIKEMERKFAAEAPDGNTLFQLGTCPICQRRVSHGEFGIDNIMFYLEGDPDKKPAKIRSLPRIWCTPCAKQYAKKRRQPYIKTKEDAKFSDVWDETVEEIRISQGGAPAPVVAAVAAAAVPANEPTKKLWAWLAKTLVTSSFFKEGKIEFKVVGAEALPGSDLDLENKKFAVKLRVFYEATTALVSGEAVEARGSSVVDLGLETDGDAVSFAIDANERCTLTNKAGSLILERCMLKTDLIAKVWAKKGIPRFVFNKLADLLPHALKLMA